MWQTRREHFSTLYTSKKIVDGMTFIGIVAPDFNALVPNMNSTYLRKIFDMQETFIGPSSKTDSYHLNYHVLDRNIGLVAVVIKDHPLYTIDTILELVDLVFGPTGPEHYIQSTLPLYTIKRLVGLVKKKPYTVGVLFYSLSQNTSPSALSELIGLTPDQINSIIRGSTIEFSTFKKVMLAYPMMAYELLDFKKVV